MQKNVYYCALLSFLINQSLIVYNDPSLAFSFQMIVVPAKTIQIFSKNIYKHKTLQISKRGLKNWTA